MLNLTNLPTVAYSGGQDKQKEAADIMVAAAKEAGLEIPYVVHPESAHAIHPDSKIEIESRYLSLSKPDAISFQNIFRGAPLVFEIRAPTGFS